MKAVTPLTIRQAATRFKGTGISESMIRRSVSSGEIPSKNIGKQGKRIITIEEVEKWICTYDEPEKSKEMQSNE